MPVQGRFLFRGGLAVAMLAAACSSNTATKAETVDRAQPADKAVQAAVGAACATTQPAWCDAATSATFALDGGVLRIDVAPDASTRNGVAVCRAASDTLRARGEYTDISVLAGTTEIAARNAPLPCDDRAAFAPAGINEGSLPFTTAAPPQTAPEPTATRTISTANNFVDAVARGEEQELLFIDPPLTEPFVATVGFNGTGVVRVTAAGATGTVEIVRHDGPYQGSTIVLLPGADPVDRIAVRADGPWALSLSATDGADRFIPVLGSTIERTGDAVILIQSTDAVSMQFDCSDCGSGATINAWGNGRRDALVEASAAFSGRIDVPPGPVALEVRTTMLTQLPDWTLTVL